MASWVNGSFVALIALFAVACSSKPGDACTIDKHACADKQTMLACNTGRYASTACPGGCTETGNTAICNFAGAPAGGDCAGTDQGKSFCAPDKKSRLLCDQTRLHGEPCKGAGHCADLDFGKTVCDIDRASVGDYCPPDAEARYACEFEGTSQLICRAGKWTVAQPCSACEIEQQKAVCTKIVGAP